ncbi:MAG: hypothetical protein QM817_27310 [Archangium sp.]
MQLSVTSPSLVGASFALGPGGSGLLGGLVGGVAGLGSLAGLGVGVLRPAFGNELTLERAFGPSWSGIASLSVSYSASAFNSFGGGGMLGARWYAKRTFDGFFAGPELLFQASVTDVPPGFGLSSLRSYAGGVRGRAGWTQPFGEHFVVSASVGLGANLAWATAPTSQQTLNLTLDAALAAGLVF